jgi:hypothetical protein
VVFRVSLNGSGKSRTQRGSNSRPSGLQRVAIPIRYPSRPFGMIISRKNELLEGKTHSSTRLLTTNLTSTRPASNSGLCIERPTTNVRSNVIWNFSFYLTTNTCRIHDTDQPVNVVYCTAHTMWADVGVRKRQAHRQ